MKIIILLSLLMVPELSFAQAAPRTYPAERAARADNAFGFKLLAETRKTLPGRNVFQSPVGLALALAMAGNGAGGQTLQQMAGTLQWQGAAPAEWNAGNQQLLGHLLALDPKIKLEIANSLWTQAGAPIK
ncbi:MAG: serpin family protein, partial [Verrucomicrobiota bacterium]